MTIRYNITKHEANPEVEEHDYSGVILCKNKNDVEFEVPLWDVRDGGFVEVIKKKGKKEYTELQSTGARRKAEIMLKLSNEERGSKYISKSNKFI